MRQLALLGLVVSLLLGAITVFETSESVTARRNGQDRSLQSAVGRELALISGGERQTATALSLMMVNPAVRELLVARHLSPTARRGALRSAALSLATIQAYSFVPLSAACLDNGEGRELVCGPLAHPVQFPVALDRRFAAVADGATVATGSGVFLSPVTGQLSVAFLAPFRLDGHPRGLVHLDISLADARGSTLVPETTPGVRLELASFQKGKVFLQGPPTVQAAGGLRRSAPLSIGGELGEAPRPAFNEGHRAMVAALPLTVGGTSQSMAVAAIATAANPNFLNTRRTSTLALLAVALLTLIGSIAGLVISNRRVVHELTTDPLTGLRNRRALIEELARACERAAEEAPAFLWFFDLNGFKSYNDSFGHIAGDSLLARLGQRLRETVGACGDVYRLGGDEFCVLITSPLADPHALFLAARDSLTEQGGAFTVTAAAGAVEIPRETRDPTKALRYADQRMYREKASSQGGAAELITSVLHAALAQRHPDLGEHSDDVAGDVELLARTIGLEEELIGLVSKVADLHDVGKLGIPDEILNRPGPLNADEWEFMKQHTVMGEQIIAAAGPSLERVGPLIRASHERWDGKGYPDGLAGEEIPLGARIITICDSFRAMLDERVYKRGMSLPDALAELRRCAGTQFDPYLVEVFCRLVAERIAPERLSRTGG